MSDFSKLEKLNFGFTSKPVDYQVIQVKIDPELMITDWADAYAEDLARRNQLKFNASGYTFKGKRIKLTTQVISKYMKQLVRYRVMDVNGQLKGIYPFMKRLGIPVWIQFAISMIGIAHDWDRGLEFVPVLSANPETVDIEEMLLISNVLRSFEKDGKPFFTNAWPKSKEGSKDVMSYAIIDGFVSGNDKDAHPLDTYVAGFLGMKIAEEVTFKMLYRINYDEVNQLRMMLMTDDAILE